MSGEKIPDRPEPPRLEQGPAVPPAPPSAHPSAHPREKENSALDSMRQRMESMENELVRERERARAAEELFKQRESLRGEVEDQLKRLSEQYKQQKTIQQMEEDRAQARGRIESLERRLDEMHKTWSALLKDAIAQRPEPAPAGPSPELAQLSGQVAALKQSLATLPGLVSELHALRACVPSLEPDIKELREQTALGFKRREEDEKLLRELLLDMVERGNEGLAGRLDATQRAIARHLEELEGRFKALARERASLDEALEEGRHAIRQEYQKERNALASQFNSRLEELAKALEGMASRQGEHARVAESLQDIAGKLHSALIQPARAKDQVIQELEQEKRDLMKALKDRAEQMRAHALERREVEQSLGDSLMDLTRQLEGERAQNQELIHKISELELNASALKAEADLKRQSSEQKEERLKHMASERDEVLKALAEEAAKTREHIAAKTQAERLWQEKAEELQKSTAQEREAKLQAERMIADLRHQLQTLTDHMTRVLQQKEAVEAKFAKWDKEREDLASALRKKDEMISMLSATFQNLLKKPS